MFELLWEQAQRSPDVPAAISTVRQITYGELAHSVSHLANGMRQGGIRRGHRIGLLSNNRIEWLEIFFAASALGATIVPFSTWSTANELEYLINDSRISWLFLIERFGNQAFAENVSKLMAEGKFALLENRVAIDAPTKNETCLSDLRHPAPLNLQSGEGARGTDTLFVLYTSGSSNRPKAVPLVHQATIENAFNIGERQGLEPGDRVLVSVPLFWAYGAINALPAVVSHRATLVLQSHFEAGGALDLIEQHNCAGIYTLPAMTNALISHPGFRKERTRSLRTGVTLGTPQDITKTATVLGVRDICNIYGGTESYGNCCVTPHHWGLEKRANGQGPPLPGVTVRIRNSETREILPSGAIGEIEVRGYLTPGYVGGSSTHNADVFTDDGFFRTGDLGFLDREGGMHFAGRSTEMIKRSGINVAPAEVEDTLQRHPDVALAGVTGLEDPQRGEIIVAFIVPKNACTIDSQSVLLHCREYLSRYKIPDHLVVVEGLPLTVTGKLMRKELRELAYREPALGRK